MTIQVGGISVEVKAALDQFDAAMSAGEKRAQDFDKNATSAMKSVEDASKKMGSTTKAETDKAAKAQKELQDALAGTGRVSAKTIQELGGLAAVERKVADEAKRLENQQRRTNEEVKNAGAAAKLTRQEALNLFYQFNDLFVGIASGQRPMTVLIQQGSQIGQVFAARPGAAAGALAAFRVLLNPVALGVAAVATALIGAAAAGLQFSGAMDKVNAIAGGVGRNVSMTGAELESLAERGAAAGEVSVSAARKMETAYLQAGVRSSAALEDLIDVTRQYANATGTDLDTAIKTLGADFGDPAKGADALNQQLGILDDSTRQYIQDLIDQNNTTEAQRVLAEALKKSLEGVPSQLGGIAGAWDMVARGAANAWNWIGKATVAMDNFVRIAPADFGAHLFGMRGPGDMIAQAKAAAEANQKAAAAQAQWNRDSVAAGNIARSIIPGEQQLNDLRNKQIVIQKGLAAAQHGAKGDVVALSQANEALGRAIATWIPPAEKAHRLAQLDIQIANAKTPQAKAALARQKEEVQLSGQAITKAEALTKATDAAGLAAARTATHHNRHADSLKREAESMEANTKGALELAEAYLQSDSAAMKAEASRAALTRAARSGADADAQVRRQLALTIAEAAAAGGKNAASMQAQADAQKAANEAVAAGTLTSQQASRQMQQELALRPLLAAQALAEGHAKEVLTTIIDKLRAAYGELNDEEAKSQALSATQSQKDQNEVLQKQLELVSANNQVRAVALAQLQAEQQLRRMGVGTATPEGQGFVKASVAGANLQSQIDAAEFMKKTTDSVNEEVRAFREQAAVLGMTNLEADRYRKLQELTNAAVQQGIPLTDAQKSALEALADGYAQASDAARKLEESQKAASDAANFFGETATQALTDIIFESGSASDALHNLVRALGQAVFQALLLGQGPLAGLFGTASSSFVGGPNGGIFSQIFGSILGVGSSGAGTGIPTEYVGLIHTGGRPEAPPAGKSVPSHIFMRAPRLHDGLAPDEFPAILQRGERVQSRREVAMGGRSGNVYVTVNTPDVGGFRRNARQLGRQLKQQLNL